MASLFSSSQSTFTYYRGYFDAIWSYLPHSLSDYYGKTIGSIAKLISLPLPLLSFIALPLFGGTSTSISLFFFYLTWATVVFTHSPLEVEIVGSLIVRLVFFLLPALAFLAFDYAFSGTAKSIKTYGANAVPNKLGRDKLIEVAAVASLNIGLSIALQAAFELLFTKLLLTRSLIRVSTILPLPLSILQDFLRAFVVRGFLHFWTHRYLLHGYNTPLKHWHESWQHSIRLPFSLVAAYDHPACFIVGQFLPTIIPAYLFRFHVLTLHLYLALVSLEQLLIYSGYSVLPSRIILGGMARRVDAHFWTFKQNRIASNFGHWGVLDVVYATGCKESVDILEDIQTEASKHRVKERASAAVEGAKAGVEEEERAYGKPGTSFTSDEAELDANTGKTSGIRRKLTRRRKD